MERIKKFLDALRADPKARELIGDADAGTREEALKRLGDAATALGFSLTGEEIVEGINKLAEEQKAKTALAQSKVAALDQDNLAQVAGGREHSSCFDTYSSSENCDFSDRCNMALRSYKEEENCKLTWQCKGNFN